MNPSALSHISQHAVSTHLLFESAPAQMIALDANLRVTAVTDAHLEQANADRGDVVGKPFSDLMPFVGIDNTETISSLFQALIRGDIHGPISTRIRSATRGGNGYRIECRSLHDGSHDVCGLILRLEAQFDSDRDGLSFLKNQQMELLRSNQELEQFAYVASHDLQEPLRMIISHLQILQRRYRTLFDDHARENMAFVTQAAERMRMMVLGILEFSRIGCQEPLLESIDSSKCLAEALKNLSPKIDSAGAVIQCGSLPKVSADYLQLVRVFQNLVGNAIKFRSTVDPVVRIEANECDSHWRFSICDNGIGIPAASQGRLFRLFERAHRDHHQGSGIGLVTCKRLIEHHRGTIWLESKEGEGSSFFFTLPKTSEHADA